MTSSQKRKIELGSEQKEFLLKKLLAGVLSVQDIAAQTGYSRNAIYLWRDAYQKSGIDGLREKSRARHTYPEKISPHVRNRILKIRKNNRMGAVNIQRMLRGDGIKVSVSFINAVLRSDLNNELKSDRTDKSNKTNKTNKTDKTDKTYQTNGADRIYRSYKTYWADKAKRINHTATRIIKRAAHVFITKISAGLPAMWRKSFAITATLVIVATTAGAFVIADLTEEIRIEVRPTLAVGDWQGGNLVLEHELAPDASFSQFNISNSAWTGNVSLLDEPASPVSPTLQRGEPAGGSAVSDEEEDLFLIVEESTEEETPTPEPTLESTPTSEANPEPTPTTEPVVTPEPEVSLEPTPEPTLEPTPEPTVLPEAPAETSLHYRFARFIPVAAAQESDPESALLHSSTEAAREVLELQFAGAIDALALSDEVSAVLDGGFDIRLMASYAADGELLGTADELLVEFSPDGEEYFELERHVLGQEDISNAGNKGYFEYELPVAPKDINAIENWRIRFTHVAGANSDAQVFVDSAWFEIIKNRNKIEKAAGEKPRVRITDPSIFMAGTLADNNDFSVKQTPDFDVFDPEIKTGKTVFDLEREEKVKIQDKEVFEELSRAPSLMRRGAVAGRSAFLGIAKLFGGSASAQERAGATNVNLVSRQPGASGIRYDISPRGAFGHAVRFSHDRSFSPGAYQTNISYETNDAIYEYEKDFSWGVLAVNFDRSVYVLEDEEEQSAYVQMAVLNDIGSTICDAQLEMEVRHRETGRSVWYRTRDGTIQYSGSCGRNNITEIPDYFARVPFTEAGTYEVTLTAIQPDTRHTISDSFSVVASAPVTITRKGPTRIYPPAEYGMEITVSAPASSADGSGGFSGTVTEYIPESFLIVQTDGSISADPPVGRGTRMLTWQVELAPGELKTLRYVFDAPDISPYLFLLGPAEAIPRDSESSSSSISAFTETRQWQIASDEVANNGVLFYGDATNIGNLKFRTHNASFTFNGEISTATSTTASAIAFSVAKAAPNREELTIGYQSVDGRTTIMRGLTGFDAAADYSRRWSATTSPAMTCSGVTENDCTRTFDIAYEQLSGRLMVVYANNANQKLYYCLYDGTSWSPVANCAPTNGTNDITLTTNGRPTFVSLKAKPRSNEILIGVSIANGAAQEVEAMRWTGSTTTDKVVATDVIDGSSATIEHGQGFDVEWESLSGDALVVWSTTSTTEFQYKTLSGGVWSSTTNAFNTFTDASVVHAMNADRDDDSNRIAVVSNDSALQLSAAVWKATGTAGWSDLTSSINEGTLEGGNADVGLFFTDVIWQTATSSPTSTAIIVGLDAIANQADFEYSRIDCNDVSGCAASAIDDTVNDTGDTDDGNFVRLSASPNSSDIMALFSEIDRNLMAQRWSGSAWQGASTAALEADVHPATSDTTPGHGLPASFVYIPYKPWSMNWRWYAGTSTDPTPSSSPVAAENATATSIAANGGQLRLRFNMRETTGGAETDSRKKLQFTTSSAPDASSSIWTDVGNVGSSTIWRYFDCAGGSGVCDDGGTLASTTLASTTNAGWWNTSEDAAPSSSMDHGALTVRELEFPIESSGALSNTTYFFRMYDVDQNNAVLRLQPLNVSGTALIACAGGSMCAYPAATTAPVPDLQQIYYRWRNNDGDESGATWAAATNTPITNVEKQTVQRLRFEISNEGSGTSTSALYRLEYATSATTTASAWTQVGTSSAATTHWVTILSQLVEASNTSNVANGLDDANPTFIAGRQHETSSQSAAITLGITNFTELEYSIAATTTASYNQTYYFRLTDNGTTTNFAYAAYASATISDSPSNLTQIRYRWRNDDGKENTVVDYAPNTGRYASVVAVNSSTIFISYECASSCSSGGSNDLMFAKSTDGGVTWSIATIDNAADAGHFTSIGAIDSSTIFISYQANSNLMFAKSVNGGTSWATSTITGGLNSDGYYTSISVIDSSTIFISQECASACPPAGSGTTQDLMFAKSTNGGTSWTTSTIEGPSNTGEHTSIHAVDSSTIFISSYCISSCPTGGGGGDLVFAKSTNGGTSWTTSTIENVPSTGQYTSLGAVDSSTIFISYFCASNCPSGGPNDLVFARSVNGGSSWTTSTVDNASNTGKYTSLGVIDSSTIVISYQCVAACPSGSSSDLMFAKSTNGGTSWTTSTIDSTSDTGYYTSIHIVDSSTIVISYQCVSSCPSGGSGDLMFIKSTDGGATWSGAATFAAAEDQPITGVVKQTIQRLRLEVSNEGGTATSTSAFRIEYSTSTAGGWAAVGTTSDSLAHWVMKDSSYIIDGASTTNVADGTSSALTDMNTTFDAGQIKDTGNQIAGLTLASSSFTEVEYAIAATTTALDSTTYYFRVTNAGAPIDTYTTYASATLAEAPPNLTQIHYRWRNDDGEESDVYTTSTIDGAASTGRYTSITAPSGSGTIYISYQCATTGCVNSDGDLNFAKSTDGGQTWTTSTIDGAANTGRYTSITAPSGTSTIYISYECTSTSCVNSDGDLNFAKSTDGGQTWTTSTIDGAGNTGHYTSITAPSGTSTIYISYQCATTGCMGGDGDLNFAKSTDGGQTWTTSTVDGTGDTGRSTFITAPSGTSTIYISYNCFSTGCVNSNGDLSFAKSTNGGTTWTTSTIDGTGNTGYYSSIAAPNGTSTIYIGYYCSTTGCVNSNGDLNFAKSTDGGQTWTTSTIDGAGSTGEYISIAAPSGTSTLYISYNCSTLDCVSSNGDLNFAEINLAATFAAAEDQPISNVVKQTTKRVRLEVSNEGGTATSTSAFRIEYSTSTTGGWAPVGTTSASLAHWVMKESTYIIDGASTTNVRVGTSTALTDENSSFAAGQIKDAGNQTAGILLSGTEFTELEYSISATTTAIASTTYYFRVTNAGTAIDTYTKYASATLADDPAAGGVTVSGVVYSDLGQTTATSAVKLVVNGATSYAATTNGSGAFTFSSVVKPATGTVFHIYLDNNEPAAGGRRGALVSRWSGENLSGMDVYFDNLIIRHEDATSVTDANVGVCDMTAGGACTDTDLPYDYDDLGCCSGNGLTVSSTAGIYIWPGKTFAPGENVRVNAGAASSSPGGDIRFGSSTSVFSVGTGGVSVGGDWHNSVGGTFTKSAGQTVTLTATGAGYIISSGNRNFERVTFNGSGGTWAFVDATGTLDGDLTMTAGTLVSSGTINILVNGGDAVCGATCGTINLTLGTFQLAFTGSFGSSTAWIFNNLTFGDGSEASTTSAIGSGNITVSSTLTIAANHILGAGTKTWILAGTGTPFVKTGTFNADSSSFSYRGEGATNITATTYYNLLFEPVIGTLIYTLGTGGGQTITVNNNMTTNGITDVTVTGVTNDPTLDIAGNFSITGSAIFSAPTSNAFSVGGNWSNSGTFRHSTSTVIFDAPGTGRTINTGGDPFYNTDFNSANGGWTVQTSGFLVNNNLLLTAASTTAGSWAVQFGLTITVLGQFTNAIGGAATDWSSSTLVLNSGTSYSINASSTGGDVYGMLDVRANTDIRMWNSVATNTVVASTGSLYSQDHDDDKNGTGDNGKLFIWGDYHTASGTVDYWSYNTDFNGDALGGSPRQALVRFANSATSTVDVNGQLQVAGGGGGANQFTDIDRQSGGVTYYLLNNGSTTVQEAKMTSSTFASGTWMVVNTQTVSSTVSGGRLIKDWYFSIHAVNVDATSTNIDTPAGEVIISEASSNAAIFLRGAGGWGAAAGLQVTETDSGGHIPQPNTAGAIRIREFVRDNASSTYYRYNVFIESQPGYFSYDYRADQGGNWLTSADNSGGGLDLVIGNNWYRDTISTENTHPAVNDPPTGGTLFAGVDAVQLSFTLSSVTMSFPLLSTGNNFTATGTTVLTVTTNAVNGYNLTAYETGDLTHELDGAQVIANWAGTNGSPTSWTSTCIASSECGFGYSSNDPDLTQFTSSTFAGFVTSTPGETVARANNATTSDATTLTYRVSVGSNQRSGNYRTTVRFILTPQF